MKRFLIVLLLILGCAATGFGGFWLASHKMTAPAEDQVTQKTVYNPLAAWGVASGSAVEDEDADITEITFSASGDNLLHSYLYTQAEARAKSGTYDFSYCYKRVADFFKETDINWINQETVVTDTLEPSSYPRFSSPGQVIRDLYDVNFRIFNTSTNHIYDKGSEGLTETEKFWESMPDDVLETGLVKEDKYNDIPIYEKDGIKFAFLSYTYGTNGLSHPDDSDLRVILLSETDIIEKQMKKARKKADVVIVSCHWGNEDTHTISESQRSMARQLADWGADLIIGTHPHVVQDAEWIKTKDGHKTFCAYSLGNFISGQDRADNLIGATLSLTFEVKEDMLNDTYTIKIKKPKLIPVITDYRDGHADLRVYWLENYSREMADSHGVRSRDSRFGYDYIFDMLKENVNKKFLKLPPKQP